MIKKKFPDKYYFSGTQLHRSSFIVDYLVSAPYKTKNLWEWRFYQYSKFLVIVLLDFVLFSLYVGLEWAHCFPLWLLVEIEFDVKSKSEFFYYILSYRKLTCDVLWCIGRYNNNIYK